MDMQIHLCRQQRYCYKHVLKWHSQRTLFYLILFSFPYPPAGIQPKWVMNWLPLMWMVNISSPALQSLPVNIYRDWGILSYLSRSIFIFPQIQRRNGTDCQGLQRHQIVKRLVKTSDSEGASYLQKELSHPNEHISWKFNIVLCVCLKFQAPERKWFHVNLHLPSSFNIPVKSISLTATRKSRDLLDGNLQNFWFMQASWF